MIKSSSEYNNLQSTSNSSKLCSWTYSSTLQYSTSRKYYCSFLYLHKTVAPHYFFTFQTLDIQKTSVRHYFTGAYRKVKKYSLLDFSLENDILSIQSLESCSHLIQFRRFLLFFHESSELTLRLIYDTEFYQHGFITVTVLTTIFSKYDLTSKILEMVKGQKYHLEST